MVFALFCWFCDMLCSIFRWCLLGLGSLGRVAVVFRGLGWRCFFFFFPSPGVRKFFFFFGGGDGL